MSQSAVPMPDPLMPVEDMLAATRRIVHEDLKPLTVKIDLEGLYPEDVLRKLGPDRGLSLSPAGSAGRRRHGHGRRDPVDGRGVARMSVDRIRRMVPGHLWLVPAKRREQSGSRRLAAPGVTRRGTRWHRHVEHNEGVCWHRGTASQGQARRWRLYRQRVAALGVESGRGPRLRHAVRARGYR